MPTGRAADRDRGLVTACAPLGRAPADARRRAGQATRVSSIATMAAAPAASTVASALTPGSGSARAAAGTMAQRSIHAAALPNGSEPGAVTSV